MVILWAQGFLAFLQIVLICFVAPGVLQWLPCILFGGVLLANSLFCCCLSAIRIGHFWVSCEDRRRQHVPLRKAKS